MRKKPCPLEKEVMDCLHTEKRSPEILKHLTECSLCQEAVSVHQWINQFKTRSWNAEMLEKSLPNPQTIWDQAFAKQRPDRTLQKKALRPLIYPRVFSYPVFTIGILFLFLFHRKEIGNLIDLSSGADRVLDSFSKIIVQFFPLFLIPVVIVFISILFCGCVEAWEKRKNST
ncbi:MAG: hypothetical protein WCC06_02210 [Candidatus Aminicenantales bacterium]